MPSRSDQWATDDTSCFANTYAVTGAALARSLPIELVVPE